MPGAGMIDCRLPAGAATTSYSDYDIASGEGGRGGPPSCSVGAAEWLRGDVFKVASAVPGLADISDALMEAGAQPQDLLSNPLVLSVIASGGLGGGSSSSSYCVKSGLDLQAAVRRWEDWQRQTCGPDVAVAMSDWPTCFATSSQSDDVIVGTIGGGIAVLRPGGRRG